MNKKYNRRVAIKKGIIGAGSLILGTNYLNGKPFLKEEKLGVALVGLGRYSLYQLGPALQLTNFCKLSAIVTGTPEKAKKWSEDYNIPKKNIYNYDNFDDIKNNPEIDIIYIVLPNFMHAEYTIRALEAGKHVICEKPMAMNSKECEKMIAAAKKVNKKLGIGYRLYYEPHHTNARKISTSGEIGKVNLIEASLGYRIGNPKSWRLSKKTGGWGALGDLGMYAIQGCRRMVDDLPTKVTAQGFTFNKEVFKDIYETVMWQMEFPNGTVTNSSTSYSTSMDSLFISAQKDWIRLQPSFTAGGASGSRRSGKFTFEIKKYQQIDQMDDFAKCILNDTVHEASGDEGLIDIKIIEAIHKAIKTGKDVSLDWK